MRTENAAMEKIKMGVSSCLLGELVRWNGDHKQDVYVKGTLGDYFEWVPVCPEVGAGMGVPRETVRLVKENGTIKMLGSTSLRDWTGAMNDFSDQQMKAFQRAELSGFIFKKGSPSCGMERVSIYSGKEPAHEKGSGLFAAKFMKAFPLIPVEEEGRLHDAAIRENFIVRVFSFERLKKLIANFSLSSLVKFHTAHKYLIMSHSVKHYRILGRMVAESKGRVISELKKEYSQLFMESLTKKATAKKHTNVLQHMMGYLKHELRREEKEDLLATIDDYRNEMIPLVVPLTLVAHYVKKLKVEYLLNQIYLNPHPKELMLRNHV